MLGKNGVYLITDPATRLYFTGYSSTDGYLLLVDDKGYFVIDSRYFYAAKRAIKGTPYEAVNGAHKELAELIKGTGCKVLYVDFSKTTMREAQTFAFLGVELKDCHEEVVGARIVKNERELRYIKRACVIAEQSLNAVIPEIKEGVTEGYIAALLECEFKKRGAEKPSFDTIVAFGANAAVPHHETGSTVLKRDSVVLIDFGCKYKGYCSDITRTMFFGTPSKEFKEAYGAVRAAFEAAYVGIREGMTGKVADGFARDVLKERGLAQYFTHSLGHGIGVDIHEDPALSLRGETQLLNGMVFSIEPGVYLDGKFGIRLENTVTLENGKVKSLVSLSRNLKVIK